MNPVASDTENFLKAAESAVRSRQSGNSGRRLRDSLGLRGLALNLDRRECSRERRIDSQLQYKGRSRRETIDRRESLRDRRAED